jgi:hypothetical protein
MDNDYEQISQNFMRLINSSTRYKATVVFSPSLLELAKFNATVKGFSPETHRIDALKLIKTEQLRQINDPINARYWLYSQCQSNRLNNLTHFDWVIGKWTRQQSREWWQLLSQTEVPLILYTILKPLPEFWQTVANEQSIRESGRLLLFKPISSKFKFTK